MVISKSIPNIKNTDIDRFWSKVKFTANNNSCWEWSAFKLRGYGKFSITISPNKDLPIIATRLAYFLHYKIDPIGFAVLHKCDNPSCCNPNHLFLGTNKDNTNDMYAKGRANPPKGNNHWGAKINEEKAMLVKERYKNGETQREIAITLGINQSVISRIIHNKAWNSINN